MNSKHSMYGGCMPGKPCKDTSKCSGGVKGGVKGGVSAGMKILASSLPNKGVNGGAKKRELSEYNKFVKKWMAENQRAGCDQKSRMSMAAEAWQKSKK